MIVVCTTAVPERFDGFLRSVMLNIHPGVYVSEHLDRGSRERIWEILRSWWEAIGEGSILMMYTEKSKPLGFDFRNLGVARRDIVEIDGIYALERKIGRQESVDSENC